jgi:hypothetical protein
MSLFTTLITSKIAASALAAGALALGGTAAAAYSGSLPGSLQQGAHSAAGTPAPSAPSTAAPSPKPKPSRTAGASGPDATGPAAFGLCTAYSHGGLNRSSTAYASLESAAKGSANIADYCATITAAHESAKPKPDDSEKPDDEATESGSHGKGKGAAPESPSHS